ncbi:MAG TPA: MarR family transcriptional regulator [Opitutaceae bacterium]|nr:MarR family transcriptional regulator [Opitutaceae bacterium]
MNPAESSASLNLAFLSGGVCAQLQTAQIFNPSPAREAVLRFARQHSASDERRCHAMLDLLATAGVLAAILRRELAKKELTEAGFKVLAVLFESDPTPVIPSCLAEHAEMWRPSTSDVLSRLEISGLITRERDKTDRRLVRIHLTPIGREKYLSAVGHGLAVVIALMEQLSDPQANGLAEICQKLGKGVEDFTGRIVPIRDDEPRAAT